MQTKHPITTSDQTIIETTRQLIENNLFRCRHRRCDKDFTRRRQLTMENVVVFCLQKTVRSIQLHLHFFFHALGQWTQSVTPSAWSQARLKLKHTAFIELNQRAIVENIYQPQSGFTVRRWKGFRLLGIDSSLIRLPNEEEVGKEFGWVECTNSLGECGRYPQARLSALTDLLNRIVIEAAFVPWKESERLLAGRHIGAMAPEDIAIMDRGFASFVLFAQFDAHKNFFVCRCPKIWSVVKDLFDENKEGRSVISELSMENQSKEIKEAIIQEGLPEVIRVRFVTVRLSTGELEVLATNLLDEQLYPSSEFGALYGCRWGIETYYGLIKSRLDLENFSGRSPEALRQDIHATIFLSNIESVLTRPVQEQLDAKSKTLENPQQVNRAVSFHTIKSHMVALILSKEPVPQVIAKLQQLFIGNPVSSRPERKTPRIKQSAWRSYHYQRNTKKSVF